MCISDRRPGTVRSFVHSLASSIIRIFNTYGNYTYTLLFFLFPQPSFYTPTVRAGVLRPLVRPSLPVTANGCLSGSEDAACLLQTDDLHGEAEFTGVKGGYTMETEVSAPQHMPSFNYACFIDIEENIRY